MRHHDLARKAQHLAGECATDQDRAETAHGRVGTHAVRLGMDAEPSRAAKVQKKNPFSPEAIAASGSCKKAPRANAPITIASGDRSVHATAIAFPIAQNSAVRQNAPTTMPID